MAETVTQITQPPEFIEAAAKPFITQLQQVTGDLKEADLSKIYGPQFQAGLGALTQQAIGQAGGLGAYKPFLQAAQAATGPQAYQAYMSPYQKEIIDTTLSEFDRQAQKGITSIADQAIAAGAFGGGREGVQRAEYMASSDRNRSALQAQLLGQAFGQAQQAAAQGFGQQQALAQQQQNLATQQQQLAQQQLMQPLQATQALGSGITSLIAGYPGQQTFGTQPTPSPLQTALGAGATLAGIYRAFS